MNYQNLVSVLSAAAFGLIRQITQTSVLIIHDNMLNLMQQLFVNRRPYLVHLNSVLLG